jgi:ATPase subunit of ABC transporter with duplicated ATPase domains
MTHKPIQLKDLTLALPHKICFSEFTAQIAYGSRIALIGRNGSGKSSLLNLLLEGGDDVYKPEDVRIGHVPQIITEGEHLSGGQRFNAALTQALMNDPNLLLLDEPTNHLDCNNRKSLMRLLNHFEGTLIVVSHDVELLRLCVDTLWHIDHGKIVVFSGNYDDYIHERNNKRASMEHELARLSNQKKAMHQALMKEQTRAAKSSAKGEKSIAQRKWPTIVSTAKAGLASETSGNKKAAIAEKKQHVSDQLTAIRLPEVIVPKFSIAGANLGVRTVVSITDGCVGYKDQPLVLSQLNFAMLAGDRIALMGPNGSGKSTLIKAILNDPNIIKSGSWIIPPLEDIGYLDQHYATLISQFSVFDTIKVLVPHWSHADVRRHLNDFLFHKNEEVNALVSSLSGGERARLCLAQIAAKTPKLLILDEITNNLDLETRAHIIQVLKAYPGALIVISHDLDFLKEIAVEDYYQIHENQLSKERLL